MTPDVNVLVAASRDDHPHFETAHGWLVTAVTHAHGGRPIQLLPVVLAGFLRLVTNPKIFVQATPIDDAIAFIDALLTAPDVEIAKGHAEWPALRALCLAKNLSANAIPDAWIAAAVIERNEHLVTFDKGFKKLLANSQVTVLK